GSSPHAAKQMANDTVPRPRWRAHERDVFEELAKRPILNLGRVSSKPAFATQRYSTSSGRGSLMRRGTTTDPQAMDASRKHAAPQPSQRKKRCGSKSQSARSTIAASRSPPYTGTCQG